MRSACGALTMAAVVLSGCKDPCQNDSFREFRSPKGRWKVVVFQRSCGATTGFSTQASLLPIDSPPPTGVGDLLSLDDDHGKVPLDADGMIDLRVAFAEDSTLTLRYPPDARVFVQATSKNGVNFRHERLPGIRRP